MENYTEVFSKNLRARRKELGLTQKELAEILGYTEKSVSKWESGKVIAPSATLPVIAKHLKCDINSLFISKDDPEYFLGIDGGGTKTQFLLCDKNNRVVSRLTMGPCNPNDVGMENCFELLEKGINDIRGDIPCNKIVTFAGIAGGGLSGNNKDILHSFFEKFSFYAFDNASDIDNIFALSGCDRCILVIIGTGSITYAKQGDKTHRIAGWGQLFDEGGSAYTIGRDAISAALCDIDKSGQPTALTELIRKRVGESADAHLTEFYRRGKHYIASMCDLVFKAAVDGDGVCASIIEKNMRFTANTVNTALKDFDKSEAVPVFFSGGLTAQMDIIMPIIRKSINDHRVKLSVITDEQVCGALINAQKLLERENKNA